MFTLSRYFSYINLFEPQFIFAFNVRSVLQERENFEQNFSADERQHYYLPPPEKQKIILKLSVSFSIICTELIKRENFEQNFSADERRRSYLRRARKREIMPKLSVLFTYVERGNGTTLAKIIRSQYIEFADM